MWVLLPITQRGEFRVNYGMGPSYGGIGGFGGGFGMFGVMFTVVFLLITGTFVVMLIKGIGDWNKNNHSPKLTVPAKVVAKRTNVTHHRHGGAEGIHHHHTSTSYYATFEVESGDRMELQLEGSAYGLMVEGDRGKLSFQGTRFLGFERM